MRRILCILLSTAFWASIPGCVFTHDTDCRDDNDCDSGHTCSSGVCVDGKNTGSGGSTAGGTAPR